MTVVADASPICYLILIEEIDLLPKLFPRTLLPREVLDELRVAGAPSPVRTWANSPPSWITIEEIERPYDDRLKPLQKGEQAAIHLAELRRADLVLLDDKLARQIAEEIGLRVTGLHLPTAIERLTKTSFRCSPSLLRSILERFYP